MEPTQEFGVVTLPPIFRTIPLSLMVVRFSVKFTKSGPSIEAAVSQTSKKYIKVPIENFPKNTVDPSAMVKALKENAIDYVRGKILWLPEDPLSLYDDWRAQMSNEIDSSKKQDLLKNFKELLPHVLELKKALDAKDGMKCAATYIDMGVSYTYLSHTSFAIRCFHLCAETMQAAGIDLSKTLSRGTDVATKVGLLYHHLGDAYREMKDYERAIELYKYGLGIFVQFKHAPSHEIKSCQRMGDTYQKLDRNYEALKYYQRSLELAKKNNDPTMEARLYQKIGEAHFHLNESALAKSYFCRALTLLETHPNPLLEVKLHFNLGSLYQRLSAYQDSNTHCRICIEIALKNGQENFVQGAQTVLATNYVHTGELERTKELYQKSATELSSISTDDECRGFLNLSNVHSLQEQFKEALKWAHKAFDVAERAENPTLQMYAYSTLGTVYGSLDDHASAHKYYKLLLNITEDLPDVHKPTAFLTLARSFRLEKNDKDALKYAEKALSFAKKSGVPLTQFSVYQELSKLAFACGQYKDCVAYDLAAVDLSNQLLSKNAKTDFQRGISFFEVLWLPFFNLASNYYFAAVAGNSVALLEKSLLYSDLYRSKALVERLGERLNLKVAPPLSLEAIQSRAARYQTTFVFYNSVTSKLDAAWYYVISPHHIHHGVLDLTDLQNEMNFKRERPKYLRGELSSSDERGHQIAESIAEWLTSIESHEEVIRTDPHGSAKEQPMKTSLMELWHKTLIAPFCDYLPKEEGHRLTIIPDAILSSLPFAVFVDSEGKTLLDRYTLTVLPSVETLIRLESIDQANASKRSVNKACIVANPNTSMTPLKGAEKEGKQISELFTEATLLKNEEATKAALLKSMPSSSCIHLACHGVMTDAMEKPIKKDANSVYQGALVLTNDEFLYAEDVAELSLNADLAVLSACHSGKGNICKEGVVGLSHAFLTAGVSTVIGTHWGVADASTQILMEAFYKYYLQDSTPSLQAKKTGRLFGKAEALRLAMLEAKEKYPKNIQKWGAFFLLGLP